MTVNVPLPQSNLPLVNDTRRSTEQTQIMLQQMVEAIKELQDRVTALEALHP